MKKRYYRVFGPEGEVILPAGSAKEVLEEARRRFSNKAFAFAYTPLGDPFEIGYDETPGRMLGNWPNALDFYLDRLIRFLEIPGGLEYVLDHADHFRGTYTGYTAPDRGVTVTIDPEKGTITASVITASGYYERVRLLPAGRKEEPHA